MCLVDDSECFEWFNSKNRRASKAHQCGECRRQIDIGETYEYGVGKYDGRLERLKTCAHCVVAREWLRVVCGGWLYYMVQEDFREHVIGDESDLRTPRLTRLFRWMLADWRNRQGELRPVEDVKAVTDAAIEDWRKRVADAA